MSYKLKLMYTAVPRGKKLNLPKHRWHVHVYHHTFHKDIEDVQVRDVSSGKRNTALIQQARPGII